MEVRMDKKTEDLEARMDKRAADFEARMDKKAAEFEERMNIAAERNFRITTFIASMSLLVAAAPLIMNLVKS